MKRIGMGLVGAGFVGPHHVDAVRRLGFVDVVALAGSNEASARQTADRLSIAKSYGHYEGLLDDPDVHVVHVATPNHLHYPIASAAIARGKHVVSEKPLAMTASDAKTLLDAANRAGVVHAVTFNYRGNPLVQLAHVRGKDHLRSARSFIHGKGIRGSEHRKIPISLSIQGVGKWQPKTGVAQGPGLRPLTIFSSSPWPVEAP